MSSNTSAPANSDPAVPTNPPCPCTRSSATPTDAAAVFQAAPTPAQTSPRPAEGLQPTPPQSAHQRPNTRQLQAFLNTTFYRYTALVPRHLLCTFCKMVPSDPVQCRTCSNLFCARCWSARYPFPQVRLRGQALLTAGEDTTSRPGDKERYKPARSHMQPV